MPPVTITPDDVIAVAPQFAEEDPARIQLFIDIARDFINFRVWGPKARTGWIYFTLHLLSSTPDADGGSGAIGPITSEKVGDLSTTYADVAAGASDANSSTPYGRIFDQMKKTLLTTMIMAD